MGAEALFLLDRVRERDLDVFLAAHLTASEAFRTFVLRRACGEASPHTLLSCRVSVATDVGETDLLLLVRLGGSDGGEKGQRRLALMLENKINAPFQPGQAFRYHQRGEQGIRVGVWDSYRTCLVAPAGYAAAPRGADGWDSRLALEEIAEWAQAAGGLYEAVLAQVCGQAITKQANELVDVSLEASAFWQTYREAAGKLLPELEITRLSAQVSQNTPWPRFGAASLPTGVLLEHKPQPGRVDLTFEKRSVEWLRAAVGRSLPPGIQVVKAGQSAALRLEVPRVDHHRTFAEQEEILLGVFTALERLHAFGRSLPAGTLTLSEPHGTASLVAPQPDREDGPSGEQTHSAMLAGLAGFSRAFEAPGFQFATWHQPVSGTPGLHVFPACNYGDDAVAFIKAAYELGWVRQGFNWSDWMGTPEAKRLTANPKHIAEASFDQLAKLLTALVCGDRFNEGGLRAAFDAGLLAAIVRRAEAMLSTSQNET